ncbi:hypothetical protein NHX12_023157 [Muraenolepis orangiensis]|uniref:Uncharacterized protein n=1 Tax=Muraenolepis orangiensis TaxID=630683 RepID=A0A9Q0EJI1_9TELE|nr:hypothetical protein NHX12_023157 [Muraenolepis orangiensis]
MGRDLLTKLGAEVRCSGEGLTVTFRGQNKAMLQDGQRIMLMRGLQDPAFDLTRIYWFRLRMAPGPQDLRTLSATYLTWKKWITEQREYVEPVDPWHYTMNYTTETDEIYDEAFIDKLNGEKEELVVGDIYLGPEGVAAAVELTEKQEQWYAMRPEKVPHITRMVGKTHTAKQLEPMIQQSPLLQWSPEGQYWRICHKSREEGFPWGMKEVYERIDKFDLWAKGAYDVGRTPQHCIKVPLKDTGHSVWQAQYQLKPEAVEGIRPTIAGLLQAGLFSDWCCYKGPEANVAPTWHQRGINVASTWHQRGINVASTWHQRGINVAPTWHQRGINVASTWHQRGINVASTWRQRGINVASTWHQRGINVASTWHQRGINVASTWHQRGINVASTWHQRGILDSFCG